jgi:hypothetical protein
MVFKYQSYLLSLLSALLVLEGLKYIYGISLLKMRFVEDAICASQRFFPKFQEFSQIFRFQFKKSFT